MENRVIKFRYLWKGQWYYIDFINDNLAAKFEAWESVKANSPLIQFTGLLDKNGKEIYEGDILGGTPENRYCGDTPVAVKFAQDGFVAYNPNCCASCKNETGCISTLSEALYVGKLEVIGNIFENKNIFT